MSFYIQLSFELETYFLYRRRTRKKGKPQVKRWEIHPTKMTGLKTRKGAQHVLTRNLSEHGQVKATIIEIP